MIDPANGQDETVAVAAAVQLSCQGNNARRTSMVQRAQLADLIYLSSDKFLCSLAGPRSLTRAFHTIFVDVRDLAHQPGTFHFCRIHLPSREAFITQTFTSSLVGPRVPSEHKAALSTGWTRHIACSRTRQTFLMIERSGSAPVTGNSQHIDSWIECLDVAASLSLSLSLSQLREIFP